MVNSHKNNIKTLTSTVLRCKKDVIKSKNFFLKIFLFFITVSSYSQQKNTISGVVLVFDNPYNNVYVKNLSSNKEVITDKNGEFILEANLKDTLLFSSTQLIDLKIVLIETDFIASKIKIVMEKKPIQLEEVTIKQYPNIDAVSLGIIPKKIKKLTNAERKLKKAGDFKPKDLITILGGSLALDPIFNSINGKTKKLKQDIEIEKKESNLLFLENNYYNYLNKDLKTLDEDIKKIFYYAIEEENIQILIDNKDTEKIKFLLCDIKSKI